LDIMNPFTIEQQRQMNPVMIRNEGRNDLKQQFEIEKKKSYSMDPTSSIRPNFQSREEEKQTIRPRLSGNGGSMDDLDLLVNQKMQNKMSDDEASQTSREYQEEDDETSSTRSSSSSRSKRGGGHKHQTFPMYNFKNASKRQSSSSSSSSSGSSSGSSYTSSSGSGSGSSGSYDSDETGSNDGSSYSGSGSSGSGSGSGSYQSDDESGSMISTKKDVPMTYEEIMREKQKCLDDIGRMQKRYKFETMKQFSLSSPLEEIRAERDRLKRERDLNQSLKFQRKVLIALSAGAEWFACKKGFNSMDKWSESVMENIDDYDEVFEELFDKYNSKVSMPPEMKLLGLIVGSAAMHHFSNSIFKSAVPGLGDMLRSNPDLMRNISEAALNTPQMQQNPLGSFMMRQGMNMYANNVEEKQQQQRSMPFQQPSQPPMQQQRPSGGGRMRGPTEDVGDILQMLDQRTPPQPPPSMETRTVFQPPTVPTMINPFPQRPASAKSDTDSVISVQEKRTRRPAAKSGGGGNKKEPIQLHF
jgi:Family of unknown function (DUF5767)